MTNNGHLYSVFLAPRGGGRMAELGNQIAQQYLSPRDKLIGIIGDAGSGKSMLIKGMFPGLELTNDDEGVNVRPLPLLDMLDDPLGGLLGKSGMGLFATPPTYHLDVRFEQGFTQTRTLADAIMAAVRKGKRVIVEHFELVYPFLFEEGSDLPINADIIIGVGEEVIVTRPNLFGPIPSDIAGIVYDSIGYRKMVHSAEDITGYFLEQEYHDVYEHADVRHGFVLCFHEKPNIDLEELEKKVKDLIAQDVKISHIDDTHVKIGDFTYYCTSPRNHVKSAGKITGFTLMKEMPFDSKLQRYLLVGLVAHKGQAKLGEDIDKIERIY